MKSNEEKCHLLVFGEQDTELSINVGAFVIKESKEKLFAIVIDQKVNFKQHLNAVCRKASQKLHFLARGSTHMPKEKN